MQKCRGLIFFNIPKNDYRLNNGLLLQAKLCYACNVNGYDIVLTLLVLVKQRKNTHITIFWVFLHVVSQMGGFLEMMDLSTRSEGYKSYFIS